MHAWILVAAVLALAQAPPVPRPRPHAPFPVPRAKPHRPLTLDDLVDIKHPSRAAWSPDGRAVAFVWDRAGVQNVSVVPAADGAPLPLTRFDSGLIDGLFWSHDGATLYFERAGDLWQTPSAGGSEPSPLWTTAEPETDVAPSPDGRRVAFARGSDLWVRDLPEGSERRLTETPADESGPTWSPDGQRLAFAIFPSQPRQETRDYVGPKIAFRWQDSDTAQVGFVAVAGGPPITVEPGDGADTAPSWLDASRLCFQRQSRDLKTREVVVADVTTGDLRVLHRDFDPKWWSLDSLGAEPIPSPDGRLVAFISDVGGWDHLYVVPAAGGTVTQVTRGKYEVRGFAWSPDGRRIAYDANRGANPGGRQLSVADVSDLARPRSVTLTGGSGTNTGPAWSPDGTRLLYQHADRWNSADLHVIGASLPATTRRLSQSMPASLDRSALVEPEFIRYASKDGQSVPAYLFAPKGLNRNRKHPCIVWVHGDGITQNFDGWHTRRDYAVYYSFHQYLAQRGYVVLAVDYRGSIGYGRDWRQGHFRDLGGKDYEDIAAGVDYLKTLGLIDAERIGIWGLSYGGFMALQAATVTPELFRCAIDVAGVVDWREWYQDPGGPWIRGRMGTPEQDPDLYRRSAPIERVDKIVRPLMVMHGTADVNVPFLESVRFIDTALKAGKDVEFAMYPGELHYFHRAHVLRDAWSRVQSFFDRHLRATAEPAR